MNFSKFIMPQSMHIANSRFHSNAHQHVLQLTGTSIGEPVWSFYAGTARQMAFYVEPSYLAMPAIAPRDPASIPPAVRTAALQVAARTSAMYLQ